MTATVAPLPPTTTASPLRRSAVWLGPLVVVVLGALQAGVNLADGESTPGEGSVDAGFARDMAVHHAQAVEMAGITLARSDDPTIRTLATDISLTQQAQIGQMRGWLDTWGLPPTDPGPAMAWMGHAMPPDAMPGMATAGEVAQLRTLPARQAEELFARLMIRHHQGGILMAGAAADAAGEAQVGALASGLVEAQRAEIAALEDMLAGRGAETEAAEVTMPATTIDVGDADDPLDVARRWALPTAAVVALGWLAWSLTRPETRR